MLFDLLAQPAPSEQRLTKSTIGLPQQQVCDRHITEHDDARVFGNQEDYSDENESHLHCKLKLYLKQSNMPFK